jgi:hypothetical protein
MMIRTMAAASLVAVLMCSAAHAASDYLLQLGDVKGESKGGGGGGGQIEVQSFSWGATNSSSVGSSGMASGRMASPSAPPAGPGTVAVTTTGDAACAKGQHIAQASLRKSGSVVYMLDDVTVADCRVHGDPHVMELSYGKVSVSDLSVMSSSPGPKKGSN